MNEDRGFLTDENVHCNEMQQMFKNTPTRVYASAFIAVSFAVLVILLAAFGIKYKELAYYNYTAFNHQDSTTIKFYANYQDYLKIKNLREASIVVNLKQGITKTQTIAFDSIRLEKLNKEGKINSFNAFPIISSDDYILCLTFSNQDYAIEQNIEYGQIKFYLHEKNLLSKITSAKR